jgi:hypothetical protein
MSKHPAQRRVLVWGQPSINGQDRDDRAVKRLQQLKDKWEPQGVVFEHLEATKDRNEAKELLQKIAQQGDIHVLRTSRLRIPACGVLIGVQSHTDG